MTQEARIILALEGPRLSIPLGLVRRLDGDLQAAAFLSQAAYLSALVDNSEKEGWFFLPQTGGAWLPANEKESIFATMGSWEFCLGISPDGQKLVRKKLIVLGLLEERRAGIPARLHYRVDPAKYFDFLAGKPIKTPVSEKPGNKNPKNQESRIGKTGKQESEKKEDKTPAYPESNKEIEEDIEKETTTTQAAEQAVEGGSSDLIFDESIQHLAPAMHGLLADIDQRLAQDLVDELAGCMQPASGTTIQNPIGWMRGVIAKANRGEFQPARALDVQRNRRAAEQAAARQVAAAAARQHELLGLDPSARAVGDQYFSEAREKAERAAAALRT
ncbi:MAG: hypothetical protein ABS92_03840 [Thiobacillus sp. SCN 63-374]|nr:MAG: hypothetical protein ABS92_03840 [Thiobacillus sp. SCN 63-374]